ncbi:MAG: HEAT repeat domain-containing protein [Planctomycetaceae bacterium]|nr:HEAT repeat domain-containing protein [Planctomycetaceae bacterium]
MSRFLVLTVCVVLLGSQVMSQADNRPVVVPLMPELRERCLDVLQRGFKGIDDKPESFWPAMHAAEALTLAGQGKEILAPLMKRLPTETDHQRRCGLAREVVRTGRREPLDVLFNTLADEQSNGRIHAAESLYKVGELRDGKLLRAAFEQKENKRLQLMAAAAFGRQGDEAALKRLRQMLGSEDREIRKICGWVLGLIGDASDVEPLKKALAAETDELARAYFVNALACLGDATARTSLGKNLTSNDPAVRTYSAEFAGYSRSVEFRPQLIKMLDDDNVDTRVRAAQALIMFSQSPKPYRLKQIDSAK